MADPTALTGLAPTGAVGGVLVALAWIVRQWREGRQADVGYWRERAERAEEERSKADAQHAEARKHEADLARRLEAELRMGYRLREHLAAHGLALPPDLDPARRDVLPDLGLSAPLPTVTGTTPAAPRSDP